MRKLILATFLIVSIVGLGVYIKTAEAAWLTGYDHRKEITLTGQSGAGTNYQVPLEIGSSSGGDFHLDGNADNFPHDIRFTDNDGTTELDYWIENTNDDPITVWVEVADDLGSNVDIYVYYGKSGDSTTSNGSDTFDYFDNFEDSNDSIWDTTTGASYSTDHNFEGGGSQSGKLDGSTGSGEKFTKNITFPSSGKIAIRKWFYLTGDYQGHIYAYGSWTGTHFTFGKTGNTYPTDAGDFAYHNGSSWTIDDYHHPDNQWVEVEVVFDLDNGTFDAYADGVLEIDGGGMFANPAGSTVTEEGFHIDGSEGTVPDGYVDCTLRRKYVSPEPSFSSAGSEETEPSTAPEEGNQAVINNGRIKVNNGKVIID